ncbi:MAG: hypothetical protein V3575_01295 [Candidatus Absconditabacteria bacterium]
MYSKRYKLKTETEPSKDTKSSVYDDMLEFITVKTPNGIKQFIAKLDSKVSLLFKSDKKNNSSKDSLSETINKFANKR